MAHDVHDPHHASPADGSKERPGTSASSAVWFVLILVGLFIAAINFISVSGGDEGHTEKTGAVESSKEASSNQTLHGETGEGRPDATPIQHGADGPHSEGNGQPH